MMKQLSTKEYEVAMTDFMIQRFNGEIDETEAESGLG